MKNIFLTGSKGSGKTSVGQVLSEWLDLQFVDLDDVVEREAGSSRADILVAQGERALRGQESQALARAAAEQGLVVATGAESVLDVANRAAMRGAGFIVNLAASAAAIQERLAGDSERQFPAGGPSLEQIQETLLALDACYADADLRIDTTGKTVHAVADEIINTLKGRW